MWDYDKLFAEGNVVGFYVGLIDRHAIQVVDEEESKILHNYYENELLAYPDCYEKGMETKIQYIVRLDEHGNVIEKLFDRDTDMPKPMPELETGMFVLIFNYDHTETRLGYIDAERNMIIYQTGGWDYIDENKDEILKVYSNNCNCFDGCIEHRVIWRNPEYRTYLDSKSD